MDNKTSYNLLTSRQRLEDVIEIINLFPEKASKINSHQKNFIYNCIDSKYKFFSPKQEKYMNSIERILFGIERETEESFNILR